jgi:hypothetical protein
MILAAVHLKRPPKPRMPATDSQPDLTGDLGELFSIFG